MYKNYYKAKEEQVHKCRIFFCDSVDDIIYRVKEFKGRSVYVDDLPFEITESENINGSWYCNQATSEIEISENYPTFLSICSRLADEYEMKFYMDDTERFHVCAMIHMYDVICSVIIGKMPYHLTNGYIEVSDEFIDEFILAANHIKDFYFDFTELI